MRITRFRPTRSVESRRTRELVDARAETLQRLPPQPSTRRRHLSTHRAGRRHRRRDRCSARSWLRRRSDFCARRRRCTTSGSSRSPTRSCQAGKLSTEEYEVIKTTQSSARACSPAAARRCFRWRRSIAASHHERWDGAGYPAAWPEKAIPRGPHSRVADVFDASPTIDRTSRRGLLSERSRRSRGRGVPVRPRCRGGIPRGATGRLGLHPENDGQQRPRTVAGRDYEGVDVPPRPRLMCVTHAMVVLSRAAEIGCAVRARVNDTRRDHEP